DIELLEGLATRAARAIATAQQMRDQKLTASELEKKVAERTRELTAANQFLDSVIENIPNMIFVKDAKDLRFVRFNAAGEELLGDQTTGRYEKSVRRRFLRQIHHSGQHLLQLINDILDLSKVEAGQAQVHLGSVDLGTLIDDVRRTVEPLARHKSIELTTDVEPEIPLIADAAKVKQMLLNLVSNAIKFTASGGRIEIEARRVEMHVEMAVTDTGIGIAQDELSRLFTEFHQVDSGPGRQQEGTGLGLVLTKRFAELHGGSVSVDSVVGRGSTFTIRLPLEAEGGTTHAPSEL